MNADIAKTIIEQMSNQVALLITLATAVFGGLVALFVQVLIHNSDDTKTQITFNQKTLRFVIACLLLEGASIVAGYSAQGAITAVTPAIFQLDTSKLDSWSDAPLKGGFFLRSCAKVQFVLFLLGIVMLIFFMVRNRHLIGGKKS